MKRPKKDKDNFAQNKSFVQIGIGLKYKIPNLVSLLN